MRFRDLLSSNLSFVKSNGRQDDDVDDKTDDYDEQKRPKKLIRLC